MFQGDFLSVCIMLEELSFETPKDLPKICPNRCIYVIFLHLLAYWGIRDGLAEKA